MMIQTDNGISQAEDRTLDIRLLITLLRSSWWMFVIGIALAGGGAYYLSSMAVPMYTATAKILVGGSTQASLGPSGSGEDASLALDLTGLVETRLVLDSVIRDLGLPYGTKELGSRVMVATTRSVMAIKATDGDPTRAADVANALARNFIEDFQRRQLTQIAQFQATLSQFGLQSDRDLVAAQASALTTLRVVDDAVPPGGADGEQTLIKTLLAGMVGLLLVGAIVAVREALDDSLPTDLSSANHRRDGTRIPVLATIPRTTMATVEASSRSPKSSADEPQRKSNSAFFESYRFLAANLEFAGVDKPEGFQRLLITSSGPGDGKSTTVANLARTLAEQGKQVVAIDADLHKPSLHRIFDIPNTIGLTSVVLGHSTIDEALSLPASGDFSVLTTGPLPPDPVHILRSTAFKDLIEALAARFDTIIIDTPPAMLLSDALLTSKVADGLIVVVDARSAKRKSLTHTIELLQQSSAATLGLVLNKGQGARSGYGTYYSDYFPVPETTLKRRLVRLARSITRRP